MERVAVDILGPFPRSDKGNRYVLVAMDYFTKWPESYAIPDQEAETVADALVEGMFSRFVAAEVIHSDQGRNFESGVFSAMCERLGIQKTRTTPLHPQSDGLVERFNRTLAKQLAILTAEHQPDWDPLVLMAYRSAVQDSTSCTPALLMLGRELRTLAEIVFGKPPDTPAVPPGPEYARRLQDRMESAHAFARDQLQKAGIRQKRNYDIKAKGKDFRAGDLVWVYSPNRKKGRCPKLDCHWVGPCEVLEKLGETSAQTIDPLVGEVQLPEGDDLTLSCNYTSSNTQDVLQWYRQSPGSSPEFLLYISLYGAKSDPPPRMSAGVDKDLNRVDLKISSAAVSDSVCLVLIKLGQMIRRLMFLEQRENLLHSNALIKLLVKIFGSSGTDSILTELYSIYCTEELDQGVVVTTLQMIDLGLVHPEHPLFSLLATQRWQIQLSTTVLFKLEPSDTKSLRRFTETHTPSVCFEHKEIKVPSKPQ
ncbi:hypothetical protein NFI96_006518 [Prochilodus magdalenae]|nr:hypothetical protein NFI96_006518 [Prochilodus magdalenae]